MWAGWAESELKGWAKGGPGGGEEGGLGQCGVCCEHALNQRRGRGTGEAIREAREEGGRVGGWMIQSTS